MRKIQRKERYRAQKAVFNALFVRMLYRMAIIMKISPHLVGIRIMHKRKEHGFSQEKLAGMIDISKNHLSSIECGHNLPTVKVTQSICNALGGTFDYYFLGKIESEEECEILEAFEKLSPEERKNALLLLNTYTSNVHKFE